MQDKSIDNDPHDNSVSMSDVTMAYSKAESYMWQQKAIEPGAGAAYVYALPLELAESEAYQSVDPYTLEVISQLFPAPTNGIDFLARILRHAQIVQDVLPGLEELGNHVAIISTRTIRLLAKSIHMAYDTTHKYVATFCALNLLHKYKHDKQRQLVFPLQRYTPPRDLNALERLITQSRPKLQQFARGVKKRFLRLNLGLVEQQETFTVLPACDNHTLKSLFPSIVNLLHAEGIELQQSQHLARRLVGEVISKVLPSHQDARSQKSTLTTAEGRPASNKVYPEGGLLTAAPAIQETFVDKKSTLTEKSRPSSQKVYPIQQTNANRVDSMPAQQPAPVQEQQKVVSQNAEPTVNDPMGDLLELYYNLLTDEGVDWSRASLPFQFIEELYQNLLKNYQNLKEKGLLHNIQGNLWSSVESSIIRRLSAKYTYDFSTVYSFLQYCTYRTDTYQEPQYQKESPAMVDSYPGSTTVAKPVDSYPGSTNEVNIVDSTAESNDMVETVDSSTSAYQQESTAPIDRVDSSLTDPTVESTLWVDPPEAQTTQKSTRETTEAELLERKTALLALFDLSPEEIADGLGANLLALSLEDLQVQAKRYQDQKRHWQGIDEQTQTEKQAKLFVPGEPDKKLYSEEAYYVIRKRNINILFNNLYNNITLRKELKIFLAEVFDNKRIKNADDWFKVVDECDAEQLCAGFIDTIVLLHSPTSKRIAKPGGFFNSRCRTIRDRGLQADTQKRIARYAELTYDQLIAELKDLQGYSR